jgi:hypothetical protein
MPLGSRFGVRSRRLADFRVFVFSKYSFTVKPQRVQLIISHSTLIKLVELYLSHLNPVSPRRGSLIHILREQSSLLG